MKVSHAIARRPGPTMAAGLTTVSLGAPDVAKALEQFDAYVAALRACEVEVLVLDPLEGHPDAHYVEDVAVITADLAVLTRPGASSRRGEVASVAETLRSFRDVVSIQAPGTLDGGDVLLVGETVFVGMSARTNEEGARQLHEAVAGSGLRTVLVPVASGLHLKSNVGDVGDGTLVMTRAFADHPAFASFGRIVVAEGEDYASNLLLVNGRVIMASGFPDTRHRLEALQRPIVEVDTSEFRKMDGGLSCLSLRFCVDGQ